MMRLEIVPVAEQDLDDIWAFIAEDSIAAADRMLDRLQDMMRLPLEQPNIGAPRPELANDLRMIVVGAYLIFYRPRPRMIEILRVLHGRRDLHADLF